MTTARHGHPEERDKPPEKGLECKRCGCRMFSVEWTRPTQCGIRRKRICRHCGKPIWTTERA